MPITTRWRCSPRVKMLAGRHAGLQRHFRRQLGGIDAAANAVGAEIFAGHGEVLEDGQFYHKRDCRRLTRLLPIDFSTLRPSRSGPGRMGADLIGALGLGEQLGRQAGGADLRRCGGRRACAGSPCATPTPAPAGHSGFFSSGMRRNRIREFSGSVPTNWPMPGSRMMRSRAMPASVSASRRASKKAHDAVEDFGRRDIGAHCHAAVPAPCASRSACSRMPPARDKARHRQSRECRSDIGRLAPAPSAAPASRSCRWKAQAPWPSAPAPPPPAARSQRPASTGCAVGIGRRRADVDDIGARLRQRLGMKQRRAGVQKFPAVGKTVVGDVEDAEDLHSQIAAMITDSARAEMPHRKAPSARRICTGRTPWLRMAR